MEWLLKILCRSRLFTALVCWFQLRCYYRESLRRVVLRRAGKGKTGPPRSRLGALALHLLSYQPTALLLEWLPALQLRRSYLHAAEIPPQLRYDYLFLTHPDRRPPLHGSFLKELPGDPATTIDIENFPAVQAMLAETALRTREKVSRAIRRYRQILSA
jgi:hypothetical protein